MRHRSGVKSRIWSVMGEVEGEWYLQIRCPSWKTSSFLAARVPGLGCWGVRTSFWGTPMRQTWVSVPALETNTQYWQVEGHSGPLGMPWRVSCVRGKCQGDLLAAGENKCWKMGIIVRAAQQRDGWVGTQQNPVFLTWTKGKPPQLGHKVVTGWCKFCRKKMEVVPYFFFCFLWGNLAVNEEQERNTTSLKKKVASW